MGRVLLKVYVGAIALVILFVAMNTGFPLDPLDTLIVLLIIFGLWAAGALTSSLWDQTWFGLPAAMALALVGTSATLMAFLLPEGTSQEAACGEDECVHYFGHWIEWTLAMEWPDLRDR